MALQAKFIAIRVAMRRKREYFGKPLHQVRNHERSARQCRFGPRPRIAERMASLTQRIDNQCPVAVVIEGLSVPFELRFDHLTFVVVELC
jgi:hypothetical protein